MLHLFIKEGRCLRERRGGGAKDRWTLRLMIVFVWLTVATPLIPSSIILLVTSNVRLDLTTESSPAWSPWFGAKSAWGQVGTVQQLERSDQLKRSLHAPPALNAMAVFRWVLLNYSERRYGIYGRAIPTAETIGEPSALMHRGEMTVRLSVLPKSILDAETLPIDVESSHIEVPQRLSELADRLIMMTQRYQIIADPVSGETAKKVEDDRIYQAYPPYALVALKRRTVGAEGIWVDHYWKGKWTTKKAGQTTRVAPIEVRETLLNQYMYVDHLHVGGAYRTWQMQSGRAHEIEIRVIDRRFENIGGLWSEVVEIERVDLRTKKSVSLIFSQQGRLRAQRLSPELILVIGDTQRLKRRQPLPLSKRPLELSLLQRRLGSVAPTMVRRAFQKISPDLNKCVPKGTNQRQEVLIRLDLDAQGRLLSASATHLSPWPIARCVLSKLNNLRLPAPQIPSNQRHLRQTRQAFRGATVPYRVALPVELKELDHETSSPVPRP